MPAKSKAQQRFFGVVKGIQKGSGKGSGKAKKAAKDMDPKDVDDFASTKHKGKPEKVKREQRVRELIKKMVREMMNEKSGIPSSILKMHAAGVKAVGEDEVEESRVKLASKKDLNFHGNIAQLVGKKHSMGLDKKSLLMLLKALRKHASITFNEGKLNEAKVITLPNGVKVKISFGKVTLSDTRGKIELDRGEHQGYFY